MACALHYTDHYGGLRCRLFFLLHCGIGRVAKQTDFKNSSVEIYRVQFLDFGDMAGPYRDFPGDNHGKHGVARRPNSNPECGRQTSIRNSYLKEHLR